MRFVAFIFALMILALPGKAQASSYVCSPDVVASAAARSVQGPSGTIYNLNGGGCTTVSSASDLAWFSTQGFTNLSLLFPSTIVPGSTGQVTFNKGGAFAAWPNTYVDPTTGAVTLTYANTGSGTFNDFYINETLSNPQSESRTNQVLLTTSLTQDAPDGTAVLPWIVQSVYNMHGFTWGNGEHNSALYGYGQASDDTAWVSGCTVGASTPTARCPGTIWATNGVNAFADNHAAGELQHAYSLIIHNPQPLQPGGGIDLWTGMHNDGAISGTNASVTTLIDNPAWYNFIGQGISNPIAGVHSQVPGNTSQTINGTIAGTTLCLDALASGGPLPLGSSVTGAGVTARTILTDTATYDRPNGRLCWTVNNSQTVADEALTITTNNISFMAQQTNPAGEADYCFRVSSGVVGTDGCIGERYDSSIPLSSYQVFKTNNSAGSFEYMYGISSGSVSTRAGGIAVGYGAIASIPARNHLYSASAPSMISDKGFIAGGTKPTNTGSCAIMTQLGGATAGSFVANGACASGTVILSMPFAGSADITGYHCTMNDLTTVADIMHETAYAPGAVTFTGSMASGDLMTFGCMPF